MVRVNHSVVTRYKHKKILKKASGYYGARSRTYRAAYQAVIKAGQYSYRDRRQKKRLFRKLWISRINAESRQYGVSYNCFINNLNKASIHINRKMLAELARFDKMAFLKLINESKIHSKDI